MLVTGAGGAAGVAVIRHLGRARHVHRRRRHRRPRRRPLPRYEHAVVAPASEPDHLVADLAETAKRFEVDVVVCTVAEEMLAHRGPGGRDQDERVGADARVDRSVPRQAALRRPDGRRARSRAGHRAGRAPAISGVGRGAGPVGREAALRARVARRLRRRRHHGAGVGVPPRHRSHRADPRCRARVHRRPPHRPRGRARRRGAALAGRDEGWDQHEGHDLRRQRAW